MEKESNYTRNLKDSPTNKELGEVVKFTCDGEENV